MRTWCLSALLLAASGLAATSAVQAGTILTEDFDDISSLGGAGWALVNNSTSGGETGWFQGNADIFGAYEGAADSYIGANFLNAGAGGQISNWLITPFLSLNEASYLTFYTRRNASDFYDSLEVRFAMADSTDVGTGPNDVGDFSNMAVVEWLLAGPDYPTDWVQIRVSFDGAGYGQSGRIALRYVVDDTNINGDYIGIDSLVVGVPEPASLAVLSLGLLGLLRLRRARA